ncbi:unnamed protein product [Cercospora beticola]|nr:unnamed protein product [Cercospora beticola]
MDDSPLGKLAAELRNKIFEYVLIHDDPIYMAMKYDARGRPNEMRILNRAFNSRPLSLLAVCRQARDECTEMFFANNHFKIGPATIDRDNAESATSLDWFLNMIDDVGKSYVRHITVGIVSVFPRRPTLGAMRHCLFKQLRSIEERARDQRGSWNPHTRVECFLGLKESPNGEQMAVTLRDMSDWRASRNSAALALKNFKESDPHDSYFEWRSMESSTCLPHLISILWDYRPAQPRQH